MRRPSLGAVTGVSQFESEEDSEEGELMRRMRDELDIEDSTRKRREEGVGEWEKRFEGLKGVGEGGWTDRRGSAWRGTGVGGT